MDKRVPLALIITIFIQTGAFGFWVGQLANRLEAEVTLNQRQDARLSAQEAATNSQAIASATLNVQLTGLREGLTELKAAQAETNRLLRSLSNGGRIVD